ncbi:MAG: SusC/RagA family TonB-linked outer membrane protein, partial [Flavobacteriaceae bacterium]|nr:SusC/RagA family TonB-linked outer membrane protein [Flavobacteriaceae bacterium]
TQANAQEKTITGTVTSKSDGAALPGVNIVIQGTSRGAQTDFDGNYSIVASVGEVLNFSYIGMKTVSVTVGQSNTINVALEEDAASLDEVVVTALGITREKKSLGYAVTELKSDEINTVKDYNVANSLVGKVAGLTINQSGGVGAGSRITIRGNNSITGNNQALIVVDGIPIDVTGSESGGSVYNSTVTGGGITDINPEDIESVSVLKGPNAAALYGSRASNGVILITTKKGSKNQGLGVTINSNVTFENPMFLPDFQNAYGQGSNGTAPATMNDLTGSSWGAALDGSQQLYFTGEDRPYTAQPDNIKDFFETGVQSINSLAIDKGGENYSTRFSYTNNTSSSMLPSSSLESHNFNLRTIIDLSDKLSVDTKATYFTQQLNNRVNIGTEGVMAYVYGAPRSINFNDLKQYQMANPEAYDIDTGVNDYTELSYTNNGGNPYWMLGHNVNDESRDRFLGFAKVNYEMNDWLSAFIRIGGDVTNVRSNVVNWPGYHYAYWGSLSTNSNKSVEINSDFLITAKKDLSDKLNLVANVGGNLSKRTYEGLSMSGTNFKIPTLAFITNTNVQTNSQTPMRIKKVNSLYASVNLAYDDFMYLDITGRNDWSSALPKDNRSYFYPSVSFALLADKFIDPNKETLNLLKLRASWSEVGNDTDPYQINQTFPLPSQGYLGLTVLNNPSVRYNENLKPESIQSLEFGFETKLFKNRLYTDFSIYKITSKDLIMLVKAPTGSVYQNFLENIGEVQNNGVEFLIGGVPVQTEDFSWDIALNMSHNKNKLVSLIEGLDNTPLNTTNSGNVAIQADVNGGIGDIYGTVWATNEAGQKLVNAEGFPVAGDKVKLGNAQPDWLAGVTNTLNYKNLSLRFLIDGRFGGKIYSATSSALDGSGASSRTLQYRDGGVVVDAINTGTDAQNTVNITAQQYWGAYSGIAENYVYDQTNIRLREFALSYRLPSSLSQKFGASSASVGVIGRNLFFLYKKADDIDPEVTIGTALSAQGISIYNVPTVRSLGFNITLKF